MSTNASRAQAEQDAIWWQGSLFRIKGRRENTRGAIGLTEANFYAGFATPVHVHHREDEAWYVLEGELRIRLGSDELTASQGDFIFGPREIPHAFKALENGARAVLLTAPAGLEHMFLDGGLAVGDPAQPPPKVFDIERVRALSQKYGLDIIGPPLAYPHGPPAKSGHAAGSQPPRQDAQRGSTRMAGAAGYALVSPLVARLADRAGQRNRSATAVNSA